MGIKVEIELPDDVTAWQLAQFCKRSSFEAFYALTEPHFSHDERRELAYQMIAGINAVAKGLADAGFDPR